MNNGDEDYQITIDDATGILSFVNEKRNRIRLVPFSACAWVEMLIKPEAPKK